MSNTKSLLHDYIECSLSEAQPMLEIKNLSIMYNRVVACKDITLRIPEKEITTIIGPSGCGKSSLIHSINRIVDHLPQCEVSGSILFNQTNILDKSVYLPELRKQIASVFQKPSPFPFSIYKNFAIPLKEHGVKNKTQITDRMEKNLKRVALWHEVKDRLHMPATQLSGGQQQRLIIARALSLDPQVILMDEPCSALDPVSTRKIEELILELKNQYTFVIVTHNIPQAKRISDNVALFWQKDNCGYLHAQGKAEHFFNEPPDKLCESYLQGHVG